MRTTDAHTITSFHIKWTVSQKVWTNEKPGIAHTHLVYFLFSFKDRICQCNCVVIVRKIVSKIGRDQGGILAGSLGPRLPRNQ